MRKVATCLLSISLTLISCGGDDLPEKYGKVSVVLYAGEGSGQPLVVGLGGSEGGNAWTSDRWKPTRGKFVERGFAFLALEYFGGPDTPKELDRISVNAIHDAIVEATRDPRIDASRIALVGGSKGAELALLMASRFSDIKCVVAMVPGHAAFPALTWGASTSSWMLNGEEVPFVPATWSSVPAMIKGNLRAAFEEMMKDTVAVSKAKIEVEKINGPILLVSARKDEMWPSAEMSREMMDRLRQNNFPFLYRHIELPGGHMVPFSKFDAVLDFLEISLKQPILASPDMQ